MAQSDDNILTQLIAGSIWETPPPDEQPAINLVRWSVQETQTGQRHFVGYNPDDYEGRVSTAIVNFDPASSKGVTRSGRIYHLVGPAGWDSDGSWVWSCVCRARGLTAIDVTSEYVALIAAETPGTTQE